MKVNVIFQKQNGSIIGRASNTEELDTLPRIGELIRIPDDCQADAKGSTHAMITEITHSTTADINGIKVTIEAIAVPNTDKGERRQELLQEKGWLP